MMPKLQWICGVLENNVSAFTGSFFMIFFSLLGLALHADMSRGPADSASG